MSTTYDPLKTTDKRRINAPKEKKPITAESKEAWTVHYDDGKPYYHNSVTNVSVWEIPDVLVEERTGSTEWKEYRTAEGRKYYHNSELNITQWEMPPEYRDLLESNDFIPMIKKLENMDFTTIDKNSITEEEKKAAFKMLLMEKGISLKWTQEKSLQRTKGDPRYRFLTMSEKKSVIQSVLSDLRKDEKESKRRLMKKREEDFVKLLFESSITLETPYREALTSVSLDPRYIKVAAEDRDRLYQDFLDQLSRKDHEYKVQVQEEALEAFKEFVHRQAHISATTPFEEFEEKYKEHKALNNVSKLDQLKVFSEFRRELEMEEEEKYRIRRVEISKDDRDKRQHFRDLLREQLDKGNINVKTRWNEFRPIIENDRRFLNMIDGLGSTPAELFYDVIEELEDDYHDDKQRIEDKLIQEKIVVDHNTPWEVYDAAVSELKLSGKVDPLHYTYIYNDLQEKARQKIKKEMKKRRKKFNSFLKYIKLASTTSWGSVRSILPKDILEIDLTELEREEIFREHMAKRKERDDFDPADEVGKPREREKRGRHKDRKHSPEYHRRYDDFDREEGEEYRDDHNDRKRKRYNDTTEEEYKTRKKHRANSRQRS